MEPGQLFGLLAAIIIVPHVPRGGALVSCWICIAASVFFTWVK